MTKDFEAKLQVRSAGAVCIHTVQEGESEKKGKTLAKMKDMRKGWRRLEGEKEKVFRIEGEADSKNWPSFLKTPYFLNQKHRDR